MTSDWWLDDATVRVRRAIEECRVSIVKTMITGATTMDIERLRLLAGELSGLERAIAIIEKERRDDD